MNYPIITQLRYWIACLLLVLIVPGCEDTASNVATPRTITDQILEDDQFSLLRAAIRHADVGDALKGGNITFFAPTNAAFQAAGLTTESSIMTLSKQQVAQTILYHVLGTPLVSTSLPEGLNSVETVNRSVLYVNKTATTTIYINNARVTQPDIRVANGYIHVIDRLLTPTTGSLLTNINTNPNLTFLSAAIRRISASNPTLAGLFSASNTTSPLTLFAPNDDAFKADSRFRTISAIDVADPQVLSNLLQFHAVSGVVFSNQLLTGTIVTMLPNSRLAVTVTNDFITVRGNRNSASAVIRSPDQTATNGVIHIIDQVLMP
ncbi:fasciclin domain-containing protein [Spirosoma rigui]|uniref:fasciclin domain-containing protein n=1 Tax=Spirosoma rigui TaxID=564064 RepID=UPI0009B0461D|nr:fasciclin domain-containing protein [Spirosoma rigui]